MRKRTARRVLCVMKTRTADFYSEFYCLADRCPETCCANWQIPIDTETRARYHKMQGKDGQAIRRALRGGHFQNKEGRCPFLNESNLCELILHEGGSQKNLGQVCRLYPRKIAVYGAVETISLSVSCPFAAQLTLKSDDGFSFSETEDDRPPQPNELDPERFRAAMRCRDLAIETLRKWETPLAQRVKRSMELCDAVICEMPIEKRRARLFRLFAGMDLTDKNLKDEIRRMKREPHRETRQMQPWLCVATENLLVYAFDRYLPEAADDGDTASRARLCVAWCWMLAELAQNRGEALTKEDFTRLVVHFSRQTEHCDRNLMQMLRGAGRVF